MDNKINIIISTHGNLATGVKDTAQFLIGDTSKIQTLEFNDNINLNAFEEKLSLMISDSSQYHLIFTDILGGTPFNTSVRLAYGKENVSVFYGVNIPMIVQAYVTSEGVEDITTYLESIESMLCESVGKVELE